MIDRPLNDFEQKILDNIETHGWHATAVSGSKGETKSFAYSVGFSKTLGAPECIVFGLPWDLMHHMLWEVYRQVEAGAAITQGARWQGLLEGFECVSMRATNKELFSKYAISAGWYGRNISGLGEPDVYQIVWPGARDGLFPWDQGCSKDVISAQPQLWG